MNPNKSNTSRLFWSLQLGGWGLFILLNLAARQYFVHFNTSELVNSLVLGLTMITSTALLRLYYRRYLEVKRPLVGLAQMFCGSLVAMFIAVAMFILLMLPFKELIFKQVTIEQFMLQVAFSSPVLLFLLVGWSAIYVVFKKQRLLKIAQQQQAALGKSLKEARLDVLLNQLNPHFVFNAINNIRALILEDADKARDMLADLSEVMRYTMQIDKAALIPFEDELDVVKQYIALNKLQYEHKLSVEYQLAPETLALSLPPMIVQLLVENAIKHGIGKLKQGGLITIRSEIVQDQWCLSVANSGELKAPTQDSSSVGIKNIEQRLALVYGEQANFSLEPSNQGVLAMICLPLKP